MPDGKKGVIRKKKVIQGEEKKTMQKRGVCEIEAPPEFHLGP